MSMQESSNISFQSTLLSQEDKGSSIKDPILFMVSSGRSGTTLLRSILNASNQIFIPYESDFIGRAHRFYDPKKVLDDQDYEDITSLFKATSREQGWGLDREYLISCLKRYRPQNFSDVNRVINQAYHQKEGTQDLHWGIKSPALIASLQEISDAFPKSKIIHVVRDGRDVYLSYRKVHHDSQVKFGPKRLIPSVLYWIDGLRRVERFKGQVYELKYEDLLTNPDEALADLCAFVGIQYSPEMYQEHHTLDRNQKLVSPKFMRSFHAKAKQGLDPNNVGKFQNEMSKRERFLFELLSAPFLSRYGYPVEFNFLSSPLWNVLRLPLYQLAQLFNNWRYRRRDFQMLERARSNRR